MSNSIACDDPSGVVIAGVDTHKHKHVAVAINGLGARLSTFQAPANQAGYAEMVNWARTLGPVEAFGIEGTGSYGVGLASFVRRQGVPGRRGQPRRSAEATQQGQERYARRRVRSAVGARRRRDGYPEGCRRGGRDSPPDQSRP